MVQAVSGTSIDVNSLVTQLMAAERTPLSAIQRSAAGFQTRISAYGQLRSSLAAVGDSLTALESGAAFRAGKASVSDASIVGASAASGATNGSYNIEVQALAQAQKLSSNAFAAIDSVVGTGTLSIQLGTWNAPGGPFTANSQKATLAVTIDASNNTLAGVRDAINAANGGVRASIIGDGSGFRLALASTDGGTANSLRIAVADGDGVHTDTSGLSELAYDPAAPAGAGRNLTENVAAQDALLFIDGVRVVKSSNTIADAIEGVTLNLAKVNTGSTVSVTVAADSAAMKSTLDAFVKSYNSLNSTIRSLTFYDTANRSAGPLQGDATARGLQSQMRLLLTSPISGLAGNITSLPQIGLTLQTDGSLALDAKKFQAAVDANPGDLAALFAPAGRSTDSRTQYAGALSSTATGSFAINLTQAATRGRMSGGGTAGLVITAGINDALTLDIDGQSASITLTAGTYASADALAAEIQSRLAGDANLRTNGITANVSQSAGVLGVTSTRYGSASAVGGASGSAALSLFGVAPASTAGVDVVGSIGGVAATGAGQSLTSADGLRLKVTSGTTGAMGTITFTRGYGALLKDASTKLLDTTGPIAARTDGLAASIKRNTKQQDDFNVRMTILESRYRRQFSTLDATLTSMNTTLNYLTQQFAAMAKNR